MKRFAKKIYMETGYYALKKNNKILGAGAFITLLMGEIHPVWPIVSLALIGLLFWSNMGCRNVKYAIILTILHFILGVFHALGEIGKIASSMMSGGGYSSSKATERNYESVWAAEKAKMNQGVYGKDQDYEAMEMGFRDAKEAEDHGIDMGGKYY